MCGRAVGISPVNYRLEFDPDLGRAEFSGSEVLTAEAGARTSSFWLNSAELEITECSASQGGEQIPCTYRLEPASEKMHIRLSRPVRGAFELRVRFRGELNDRLLGFYMSRYRLRGREQRSAVGVATGFS